MQLYLHRQYVAARTPRPGARARHVADLRRAVPPPRPMRSSAARALAGAALRLDGDSAMRRLLA